VTVAYTVYKITKH